MGFGIGSNGAVMLCAALVLSGQGARLAAAEPTAGEAPVGAPRLSVLQQEVDLGEVIKGEVGEARFRLDNGGDAVLKIIRVKPG